MTNNGLNSLPANWREIFEIQHYADDENFTLPLEAQVNNKNINLRVCFSDTSLASDGVNPVSERDDNLNDFSTQNNTFFSVPERVVPINLIDHSEKDKRGSSITQKYARSRSGRILMKPKKLIATAMLGFLSLQIGNIINHTTENIHSISIFKAQLEHHKALNILPDDTINDLHPFSFMASEANQDVLYYH